MIKCHEGKLVLISSSIERNIKIYIFDSDKSVYDPLFFSYIK